MNHGGAKESLTRLQIISLQIDGEDQVAYLSTQICTHERHLRWKDMKKDFTSICCFYSAEHASDALQPESIGAT